MISSALHFSLRGTYDIALVVYQNSQDTHALFSSEAATSPLEAHYGRSIVHDSSVISQVSIVIEAFRNLCGCELP
jgi:hypothetical protein